MTENDILFEDNHLIIVNKKSSEIVQGDKTGDVTMPDTIKEFLKKKYEKPGNVFCGVVHRLDRPVSGAVMFAKTSKALSRMTEQFRNKETKKVYWAIVENKPDKLEDRLVNYLKKNEKQNKSYVVTNKVDGAKESILNYKYLGSSDKYHLLEIELDTGRHHQIRCQLSHIGCVIKGDLKYGSKRSNKNGSICLHSRYLSFNHPISKISIVINAPVPNESIWKFFENKY